MRITSFCPREFNERKNCSQYNSHHGHHGVRGAKTQPLEQKIVSTVGKERVLISSDNKIAPIQFALSHNVQPVTRQRARMSIVAIPLRRTGDRWHCRAVDSCYIRLRSLRTSYRGCGAELRQSIALKIRQSVKGHCVSQLTLPSSCLHSQFKTASRDRNAKTEDRPGHVYHFIVFCQMLALGMGMAHE
jgi:hypothetical protein